MRRGNGFAFIGTCHGEGGGWDIGGLGCRY